MDQQQIEVTHFMASKLYLLCLQYDISSNCNGFFGSYVKKDEILLCQRDPIFCIFLETQTCNITKIFVNMVDHVFSNFFHIVSFIRHLRACSKFERGKPNGEHLCSPMETTQTYCSWQPVSYCISLFTAHSQIQMHTIICFSHPHAFTSRYGFSPDYCKEERVSD